MSNDNEHLTMQQHDDYIPKENPDKLNDIKPQVK
jgi:hypothetical protein